MTCYAANYTDSQEQNRRGLYGSYSDKDKISEVDKLIFVFKRKKYARVINLLQVILSIYIEEGWFMMYSVFKI
jgi:hypothetical protein